MAQLNWDWQIFLIATFTLIAILFLQEYAEHRKINFANFKKYPSAFIVFNCIYVLFGGIFATILGTLLNPNNLYYAVLYAGSWEGIIGSIFNKKHEVTTNETPRT